MRVFSYVMVVDSGGAPNFDASSVTLALCKPQIRVHVELGELVLAFTGRKLGPEPDAVRWAGVVAEKLTFAEYWKDPRFARKKPNEARMPDNIYRPQGSAFVQIENPTHGQDQQARDLSGKFVLVFDPVW